MKQLILTFITCLSLLTMQAQTRPSVIGQVDEPSEKALKGQQDDKALAIYPNPSNGVFTISISNVDDKKAELSIMNVIGNEVYHETLTNADNHFSKTLDLNRPSIAKGLYYVKLESENYSVVRRIVIR
ncbi:T9SS type A sorting domain-containing protein [Pontibacter silvestris]|uniref:T9SS type A sorting domain-containing protein n=1 Tax=Pontibacter silvestris TaxID=2305183 RepID=A0ABW4WT67_9BACT|nr:T9SS type A sorting domain-containing protein [Pontibacter silvestris]MCC9138766.1 T9SS type A sorting domain-containing protein [Pontibacter silvestris]